jgi:hypothetical protein
MLWFAGTILLLVCLLGVMLHGLIQRDGQINPWNAARRAKEKSITGRDLVSFLKEYGAVQNHAVIPPNEIFREFRLPAVKAWGLLTKRGVVLLFEFEEEVDARVSPIRGCQIGLLRLSPSEESDHNIWSYRTVLDALLSPEADSRFAFSNETKAHLRNEVNRVGRRVRDESEAGRDFEGGLMKKKGMERK